MMERRLAKAILAFGILGVPFTAAATGNLDCTISDANLDFQFETLFSYSGNSPLFQSQAAFESKHPGTFAGLKTLDMQKLRLIQQWFEGKDLRLQFYAETEGEKLPFASVKLSIETAVGEDENSYDGSYRLEIMPAVTAGTESETIRLEGKASCSAG
jgi:hypothetical protein